MEKGNRKAIIFITILIGLFFCNAFKFIEAGGSSVQMTIHKKDLDKKTQMIQKKIEDYFYQI